MGNQACSCQVTVAKPQFASDWKEDDGVGADADESEHEGDSETPQYETEDPRDGATAGAQSLAVDGGHRRQRERGSRRRSSGATSSSSNVRRRLREWKAMEINTSPRLGSKGGLSNAVDEDEEATRSDIGSDQADTSSSEFFFQSSFRPGREDRMSPHHGRLLAQLHPSALASPPQSYLRPRGLAVCSEPIQKSGFYKEPFWNKHSEWEKILFEVLCASMIFSRFSRFEVQKFVRAMEIHLRSEGELLAEQGDRADGLFIVLHGDIGCLRDGSLEKLVPRSTVIDEHAVLWSHPRRYTLQASSDCIVAKLCRVDYQNLCTRNSFYASERYHRYLRSSKMLEMLDDESIAKLVDILRIRRYEEGERIISQGEEGDEFYVLISGEAAVTVRTADDEQEHMRYKPGDLFGEVALLTKSTRAASITAVNGPVEVLYMTRRQFERMLDKMDQLQARQYNMDPRKLIADFYDRSDTRGPRGSLRLQNLAPDPALPETRWFAVYRPTSREAIAKMLSGVAVGKGLNVKGKSARQGLLSGYVPFVQISDNEHKDRVEASPADARLEVYYKTKPARREARHALEKLMQESSGAFAILRREIKEVDGYEESGAFGLDLPEPLLREVYIIRPDLSPVMGWESGRRSEPAFMNANLHAIRDKSDPKVVLYQFDETDAMNPRGLLIAYAEKYVKPVVSDFDTFLVGSKGMEYEPLPAKQADMVLWMLRHSEKILRSTDQRAWTTRWLAVLEQQSAMGFKPEMPKFGFGDPTSYRLIEDVVKETAPCGAVRHGAECCNFYFPQELDEEYLVVWHGCPDKPWAYMTEPQVRSFLLDRISDGFSFPLNPVWPIRDAGWYDVFNSLRQSGHAQAALSSWFPPEAKILEMIDDIHGRHPNGFVPAEA